MRTATCPGSRHTPSWARTCGMPMNWCVTPGNWGIDGSTLDRIVASRGGLVCRAVTGMVESGSPARWNAAVSDCGPCHTLALLVRTEREYGFNVAVLAATRTGKPGRLRGKARTSDRGGAQTDRKMFEARHTMDAPTTRSADNGTSGGGGG